MKTFSKKFIVALSISFFVVLLWAMLCITFDIGCVEYVNIPVEILGVVMTGGTLGYLMKSAQENKEKIKGSSMIENGNIFEQEESFEEFNV